MAQIYPRIIAASLLLLSSYAAAAPIKISYELTERCAKSANARFACLILLIFWFLMPGVSYADPDRDRYEIARECAKDTKELAKVKGWDTNGEWFKEIYFSHYNAGDNKCYAIVNVYWDHSLDDVLRNNEDSYAFHLVDVVEDRSIGKCIKFDKGASHNDIYFECWVGKIRFNSLKDAAPAFKRYMED